MGKILVAHTHAIDEQGRAVHFKPGDRVPQWAREQLTNPKLWADEQPQQAEQVPDGVPVPSRSGPGSGRDAWAAFAAAKGVAVPAEASRDDIMAACQAAGVLDPEG